MNNKPKATRIIGIDYGFARIGVAYSDETKLIAMTYTTVTTEKKLEKTVEKLWKELEKHQKELNYTIESIVVGLPLMMSGELGHIADEVHLFVEKLKSVTTTPIITWDERLTSVQADRSLREFSLSRKKRSKIVDKVSAVIILQSYLDNKKGY